MNQTHYDMLDWERIEALVYSEEDAPHDLLGPHMTDDGLLIQAFLPSASQVKVLAGDAEYPMELEDENGFFAVLLDDPALRRKTTRVDYRFRVTFEDGREETIQLDQPAQEIRMILER